MPAQTLRHPPLTPTEERIAEAIMAALEPTGENLVRWTPIHESIAGDFWDKSRTLARLHEAGLVYLVQIGGSPFVCLGDDADVEIAARYKARGELRPVRIA